MNEKRKKRETQDFSGDDDDGAIVCPDCGMNFNTEKRRTEHYKKFPDHDPVFKKERSAAAAKAEEEAATKAGGQKTKQKRHGHRKF